MNKKNKSEQTPGNKTGIKTENKSKDMLKEKDEGGLGEKKVVMKEVERSEKVEKKAVMWTDVSSWSQSDKVRVPRSWELRLTNLTIAVHRHLHYPPDAWLMSCHDLRMGPSLLKSKDIDDAKLEALTMVRDRAARIVTAIQAMPGFTRVVG